MILVVAIGNAFCRGAIPIGCLVIMVNMLVYVFKRILTCQLLGVDLATKMLGCLVSSNPTTTGEATTMANGIRIQSVLAVWVLTR